MSDKSDLEDSESESTTNTEDLEVQLYSLVHYATDSLDTVTTEHVSTETNKSCNQQDSLNEDQANSTVSIQNSSEAVNANSNHHSATEKNELLCTERHKALKKNCRKPEKIIDYLTLLKEYKAAKAKHNFAEMSRNPSLLWFHKQQNSSRGYRKRYWMKETDHHSDNIAVNHSSDTPSHVFHNSSYRDNRNEDINCRKMLSAAPEYAEDCITPQFNGYTSFEGPDLRDCVTKPYRGYMSFEEPEVRNCVTQPYKGYISFEEPEVRNCVTQPYKGYISFEEPEVRNCVTQQLNDFTSFTEDPDVREHDGSSAAKKSRNFLDTVMNHTNHNADNNEIPYKKKNKKKHKHKKSAKNTKIDVNERAEITNSPKEAKNAKIDASDRAEITNSPKEVKKRTPKVEDKVEQRNKLRENHVTKHSHDQNIHSDEVDSRYNIAQSRKEVDDVIVLDSSDSESSIVVLGSPPPPKPPPVICLDSDNENARHQQATAAEQLLLNVVAPKQYSREKIQGNYESTEDSFTNKAVASNSTSQVTSKSKDRGMNDCWKWTAEMISYYNESWGGEHFDVISLQRQMSNNPINWRVSQRDFRVDFYQKRPKDKCTNCSQFGHAKWQCPEPPRPLCCKMCGELGHTEPRCPFPICLQCGERTMIYVRNCRNCRSKSYCTVCNKHGHSHDICPEVWRKYCTTTSSLQVRKQHGPVYKPKEQQWCCVCAKKGHFPEDCQPFYVEPITFQVNNEIHTPKVKQKKKKKYYMEGHKRKVHFGIPC